MLLNEAHVWFLRSNRTYTDETPQNMMDLTIITMMRHHLQRLLKLNRAKNVHKSLNVSSKVKHISSLTITLHERQLPLNQFVIQKGRAV